MAIFLAIVASLTFGVADFSGGFATKRSSALTVVFSSQVLGMVLVLAVVPFFGEGAPKASELGWGALGGVAGAFGLTLLYHGLATTRMNIVAPTTAVFGAAVPVVFGVMIGERPSLVAWIGVAVVIPAVVLVSRTVAGEVERGIEVRAVAISALAGVMFGLFGIFLSRTPEESGIWPLVSARVLSIAVIGLIVAAGRRALLPERPAWVPTLLAGVLDMVANVLFLVALRQGLLSEVSVIMSVYPASTIVLARVVFGERLSSSQAVGLVAAAAGVALIAGG